MKGCRLLSAADPGLEGLQRRPGGLSVAGAVSSQIESLEEWAALLKLGMVVAVRAAPAERHLEGGFWLLHVDSEAFEVPENLVHATSEYEE